MKVPIFFAVAFLITSPVSMQAIQQCMMTPLHDTHAIEDPAAVWKRGDRTPVTEVVINNKTGAKSFCRHGDYCYAASVNINGQWVEALRMTNCRIQPNDKGDNDGNETTYGVEALPVNTPARPAEPESVKDIKTLRGRCSDESYTASGPADTDIGDRKTKFNCDGAAFFFLDDQNKRIIIRFIDANHIKTAPLLGFEGVLQSDGLTLTVTRFHYLDPYASPHAAEEGSECQIVMNNRSPSAIVCDAFYHSGEGKYMGLVVFHADPDQ